MINSDGDTSNGEGHQEYDTNVTLKLHNTCVGVKLIKKGFGGKHIQYYRETIFG